MSDANAVLGLEPDDLDGHTIEELNDYLDDRRTPADASIDNSPACQIALSALQRLRSLTSRYLDHEADQDTGTDQDWIAQVLTVLPLEARAGRTFPLPLPLPLPHGPVTGEITEGALRGLIRLIGDAVPGFLVGSIRIHLTADHPAVAILEVEAALQYGTRLPDADAAFRAALAADLTPHLPFPIESIDLRIVSLITPPQGATE